MTENAGLARLWQGFHHLSESNKDLVLTVAEVVGRSACNSQNMPEQLCGPLLKILPEKK